MSDALVVDFSPMADFQHMHNLGPVIDRVDDAMISDSVTILARQCAAQSFYVIMSTRVSS